VTSVSKSGNTYAVTIADTAPTYNVQILDDSGFYACDLDTERSTFVENTETATAAFWAQDGVNLLVYVTLGDLPPPEFDQVIGKGGQAIGIPGTGQVIGKPK
jgi:hypothetical protein